MTLDELLKHVSVGLPVIDLSTGKTDKVVSKAFIEVDGDSDDRYYHIEVRLASSAPWKSTTKIRYNEMWDLIKIGDFYVNKYDQEYSEVTKQRVEYIGNAYALRPTFTELEHNN
jgi:hypothetical protein